MPPSRSAPALRNAWPLIPLLVLLLPLLSCDRPPETDAIAPPSPPRPQVREDTPQIVRDMIETHGGYEAWASAPTVRFTDEWTSADGARSTTAVRVEQSTRRAVIEVPGTAARVVWDGERAWSVDWQSPIPPRFVALLDYYFLNLPWLTQDPGVHLEVTGRGQLLDRPTEYTTVRMTFDPGVGDTPDDYYVLYIDPTTKQLAGCRYIVTYRALLPEGMTATPEHVLIYDEWTEVDGLLVPAHFTVYELDGSLYAACAIRDWSFREPFDESLMEMPEGAVIDESTP